MLKNFHVFFSHGHGLWSKKVKTCLEIQNKDINLLLIINHIKLPHFPFTFSRLPVFCFQLRQNHHKFWTILSHSGRILKFREIQTFPQELYWVSRQLNLIQPLPGLAKNIFSRVYKAKPFNSVFRIRIQLGQRIRIWIGNPDQEPGRPKLAPQKGKTDEFHIWRVSASFVGVSAGIKKFPIIIFFTNFVIKNLWLNPDPDLIRIQQNNWIRIQ